MVICSVMFTAAGSKPVPKSRSPHHQLYNTSFDNMISHSDIGEDHIEACGKFTTEMIGLLAEVHCIFAQVSDT